MKENQTFGHLRNKKPLSLYIHIPFCEVICPYCDFNKYSGLDEYIPEFVKLIQKEIKIKSAQLRNYRLKTIFFGGGTPSLIDEKKFGKINDTIFSYFNISDDLEYSIEANPKDINQNKINFYQSIGINRISVGGQSFDDNILKTLGRNHNAEDLIKSLNLLKDSDIYNINLDLIFGVPNQTLDQWKKSLDVFLSYSLPHLSTYCLTFEPKTKFFLDLRKKIISAPKDDDVIQMFEYSMSSLIQKHYQHYEISNWAVTGYQSLHNIRYWKMQDYIGIGPGSSSFFNEIRSSNVRSIKKYFSSMSKIKYSQTNLTKSKMLIPGLTVDIETKNKINIISEYVMLNLRLSTGINHEDFYKKFGQVFEIKFEPILEELHQLSLLKNDNNSTSLTNQGILVSDEVIGKFIERINF